MSMSVHMGVSSVEGRRPKTSSFQLPTSPRRLARKHDDDLDNNGHAHVHSHSVTGVLRE